MDRHELGVRMKTERQKLLSSLDGNTGEAASAPGAVGEWSVRDVVSHIVAWEEEAVLRLDLTLQGREGEIGYIDEAELEEWNRRAIAERQGLSWSELLTRLNAVRESLLKVIDRCGDEQLEAGEWPASRWLPVFTYLHDAEHSAQLLEWRRRHAQSQ